jgi:CheY-like chemotaxis protein
MNTKPLITVVEHDPMLGMLLLEVLTEEGYAVELWTERAAACEAIRRTQPDLVILALWLRQRGDGWQVLDALQRDPATSQIPVIVCTDDTLLLQADAAHVAGRPAAALEKPFDLDVLLDAVAEVVSVGVQHAERAESYAERLALGLGA